jgi:hypothetical protein
MDHGRRINYSMDGTNTNDSEDMSFLFYLCILACINFLIFLSVSKCRLQFAMLLLTVL